MKALLVIVGWCLLLVLCWLFALLRAILFLPARLLGYRSNSVGRPS